MPTLTRVLQQDDLRTRRVPAGLNLTQYIEMIDAIRQQGGAGGEVTLSGTETQRTEKGRLTRAAKLRGLQLTWRRAAPGSLRFVLTEPGSRPPDARSRQSNA